MKRDFSDDDCVMISGFINLMRDLYELTLDVDFDKVYKAALEINELVHIDKRFDKDLINDYWIGNKEDVIDMCKGLL
jgi:hypothetical protein